MGKIAETKKALTHNYVNQDFTKLYLQNCILFYIQAAIRNCSDALYKAFIILSFVPCILATLRRFPHLRGHSYASHTSCYPAQMSVCRILAFLKVNFQRLVFSIPTPSLLWSNPRPISDSQLHTLRHFHLCPIYLVVFKGSYWITPGISYLKGGFTLRCLQRLSLPNLATLLCHWYDNR